MVRVVHTTLPYRVGSACTLLYNLTVFVPIPFWYRPQTQHVHSSRACLTKPSHSPMDFRIRSAIKGVDASGNNSLVIFKQGS